MVLTILSLSSCRKPRLYNDCRSVAYVIDKKDQLGKIYRTDTSICWPLVCGDDLKQFLRMDTRPERICGCEGCYGRLVIYQR